MKNKRVLYFEESVLDQVKGWEVLAGEGFRVNEVFVDRADKVRPVRGWKSVSPNTGLVFTVREDRKGFSVQWESRNGDFNGSWRAENLEQAFISAAEWEMGWVFEELYPYPREVGE